jgi:steroid delta-isomerase-like uncharacterized protein
MDKKGIHNLDLYKTSLDRIRFPRTRLLRIIARVDDMARTNAEIVVRKYFAARNRHNLDAAAAVLDQDYAEYDPLTPEPRKGIEDWRKNEEAVEKAIPDFGFRISNMIAKDDLVAVELTGGGAFKAPLELFGRAMPPTGRPIELKMAAFYRVNSKGLIAEVREYYDSAKVFEQLGMKP